MSYSFLDFEKPISLLEKKIEDLRSSQDQPDVIQSQVDSLNKEIEFQKFLGLERPGPLKWASFFILFILL